MHGYELPARAVTPSGADKNKDALQAFRFAVLGGTSAGIEAKWKNLKLADKRKLKDETDTILKMMPTLAIRPRLRITRTCIRMRFPLRI